MRLSFWVGLLIVVACGVGIGCDHAPAPTPGEPAATVAAPTPAPTELFYAPIDACRTPGGKILVLYGEDDALPHLANAVVRFDAHGTFEKQLDLDLAFAHSISATGQGTFLISDQKHFRLLEIDEDGRVLREIGRPERQDLFNSAVRLPGGTILASILEKGIAEIDNDGNVVRELFRDNSTHDATPLPDGHVLFTSVEKGALEIDGAGQIVWSFQHPDIQIIKNARRLASGNTVLAHRRGLVEVTPAGEIVRKSDTLLRCYNFKLEPDGGVLLAHPLRGALVLDPQWRVRRTVAYRAPRSWDEFRGGSLDAETERRMKQLGYL